MKNNNIIELHNIVKQYDGQVILKGVNFNVEEGEFITLLGPSGCGKTTTLKIIAGNQQPNSGDLLYEGKNLLPISMSKRPFNTIFQSYALFPNRDVFGNIAFGLEQKKMKRDQIDREVSKIIKMVGLEGMEDKHVNDLSGGQRQRVAIARALVMKPKVLLLDEPMAALDVKLRKNMQQELKKLQNEIGITFIMVSHDQEEALSMSDRIVVMNQGNIEQIGTPEEIYNEPKNQWVAKFIGLTNLIEDGVFVEDHKVEIDGKQFSCLDSNFGTNSTNIDIAIRPEDIEIKSINNGFFNAKIIDAVFKGVFWELTAHTRQGRDWIIQSTQLYAIDQSISIKWKKEAIHVMWKQNR